MSSKRERILLRVGKGVLVPADGYAMRMLRERGFKVGDIVATDITKPRNPGFWRLAHQLGTMCRENIEAMAHLDAHAVLKKIQFDGGIECAETSIELPGIGTFLAKQPRSLSFESMDQGQFFEVMRRMCAHISQAYWPHLSPEQVADMARCMPEEFA